MLVEFYQQTKAGEGHGDYLAVPEEWRRYINMDTDGDSVYEGKPTQETPF